MVRLIRDWRVSGRFALTIHRRISLRREGVAFRKAVMAKGRAPKTDATSEGVLMAREALSSFS